MHGPFASVRQIVPSLFVVALLLMTFAAPFVSNGPLLLAALVVPCATVVLGEAPRLGRAHHAHWWRIAQPTKLTRDPK